LVRYRPRGNCPDRTYSGRRRRACRWISDSIGTSTIGAHSGACRIGLRLRCCSDPRSRGACPTARLRRDAEHDAGDRRSSRPRRLSNPLLSRERTGAGGPESPVLAGRCALRSLPKPSSYLGGFRQRNRRFEGVSAMKSGVSARFGEFLHGAQSAVMVLGQPPRRPATDRRSRSDGRPRLPARTIGCASTSAASRPGVDGAVGPTGRCQPHAIGARRASSTRTRPRPATSDPERAAAYPARGGGTPRRARLVDLRRGARRSAPCVRVGRHVRFLRSDLERWIADQRG